MKGEVAAHEHARPSCFRCGGIMKKTTSARYDTADHLRSREEVAAYLEVTFEEANGDAAFIAKALGNVIRSKGMRK